MTSSFSSTNILIILLVVLFFNSSIAKINQFCTVGVTQIGTEKEPFVRHCKFIDGSKFVSWKQLNIFCAATRDVYGEILKFFIYLDVEDLDCESVKELGVPVSILLFYSPQPDDREHFTCRAPVELEGRGIITFTTAFINSM